MHPSVLIIAAATALVAAAFVLLRLLARRETVPAKGSGLSARPISDERIVLLIRGWSEAELQHILGQFRALYPVEVDAGPRDDGLFEAAFPQGIAPATLAFLVNYLSYPEGMETSGRDIAVLARVTLCSECGIPDPAFTGRTAWLYVPENDTEGDVIHLRIDGGQTYRIPFTDLHWHPVPEARWPDRLNHLAVNAG